MRDPFGRTIDYLRVSVTEACNYRCVYCMPEEGVPGTEYGGIMSAAEIERLVRVAASLGTSKVRLTGGEPLVRKDIVEITRRVAAVPGVRDVSLTTNAHLLARLAQPLRDAGLRRVNVSLDSLSQETFARITRGGDFARCWAGVEAALEAGLHPVKLNAVVMRGINDREVADLARLTLTQPLSVRFIELMPIGWDDWQPLVPLTTLSDFPGGYGRSKQPSDAQNSELRTQNSELAKRERVHFEGITGLRERFVPLSVIKARIQELGELVPAEEVTNGPARVYRLPGARGTVGFISQVSDHICAECNRMRLTADGQVRPCLMADGEVDLLTPLRAGASDEELAGLFLRALGNKPERHYLEEGVTTLGRSMSQIGG
jgi:GTP 3',8-cyclase